MNREILQQALDQLYRTQWALNCEASYLLDPVVSILKSELAKPEQAPIQLRRGDRLRPIDSDDVVCTVWATSTTGKTLVKWGANEFCEYTAEQIGELFWLVPRHEQELAKTEPEPVKCTCGYAIGHPLVTSCSCKPRKEWVGLTDEEIEEAWGNTPMMLNARDGGSRKAFALAIEAKLKEKNT